MILPNCAKEAKERGVSRYFTGKPCRHGHVAERYVWGGCTDCKAEAHAARTASGKSKETAARRRHENPEAHRAAVKRHRERHPDRVKARVTTWRDQNSDRIKEYRKEYAAPRREKLIESHREYYHANKEAAKERHRRWRLANPEASRTRCANRRAMKQAAAGSIDPAQVAAMVAAQGGKCAACGADARLTIDHILALSRGGSNLPENLQMLCKSCNSAKKDKDNAEFMQAARGKNAAS